MLPGRLAQLEKIHNHAASVAAQISTTPRAAANEAEFRRPIADLIEVFGNEFHIPLLPWAMFFGEFSGYKEPQ